MNLMVFGMEAGGKLGGLFPGLEFDSFLYVSCSTAFAQFLSS